MNNIENRIVEMKFDNAQFEAAVAKTMETLDKFKEKLNFDNAGKGIDKLGKASGNYQYTLNDIGQSLDQLNGRFSAMGTIGRRVLENLTDSAINFAKNGLGKLFGDVTQGGLSRAMNLEQAKFQLQGILKDAGEVKRVIYDDILPELQGTPYSLDQAAVVIGQLGASGITASKDVRQATRAIAGLAAMSGRGFDEVGRIFSKVAGQGSMMGGELQQLSTYGINAAANIAEYFNKVADGSAEASDAVKADVAEIISSYGEINEGIIREAASKRMISYEDMAAAMDNLYGAHAKKSTEMYTGALEDLKAALARIGAEPAAVGLEVMRDAFNALVPAVDAVNSVLKPFTNATKDIVKNAEGENAFGGKMYGTLAKEVQGLGHSFANLFVQMDDNGKITRWTAKSVEDYRKSLDKMKDSGEDVLDWQERYAAYASEGDAVMNPHMWRILTASTESFVNILKAVRNVLQPIAKGIGEAFPKITLEKVANLSEGIRNFTKNLVLSEKNMERLKWIAQGVFTPIGLAIKFVIGIIRGLILGFQEIYMVIRPTLNAIFAFIASIGRSVSGVGNMASEISKVILTIGKFAISIVGAFARLIRLNDIIELIQKGFYVLANVFDTVGQYIGNFFSNFVTNISNIGHSISEFLRLNEALNIVRTGFKRFKEGLAEALHLDIIKNSISSLFQSIKDFISHDNFLNNVITSIKDFVSWVRDLGIVERIVNGVSTAFDKLVNSVSNLTIGPSKKVTEFLGRIRDTIRDLWQNLDASGAITRFFRDNIKIYDKLKSRLSDFHRIIEPLAKTLIAALPKLLGYESFGDMISWITDRIKTTASVLKEFFSMLADIGKAKSEKEIEKLSNSLNKFFDNKVASKIMTFQESLVALRDAVGVSLLGFITNLTKAFTKLDPEAARKTVKTLALLAMAGVYVKQMVSLMEVAKSATTVLKAVGNLVNSVASGFGLKTINTAIANTIKLIGLATSLLIFAYAVKILSSMDWKQVLIGSAIMLGALLAFWKIFKVIEKMDVKDNGKQILLISTALTAMSLGMYILTKSLQELASIDPAGLITGVAALSAVMFVFAKLTKYMSGANLTESGVKSIGKASFALIGMGQGMKMMAEAIRDIGTIDITTLGKGLVSVLAIMGMFALFAKAVQPNAKVFTASLGMIAVAGAIFIVYQAIKNLGEAVKTDSEAIWTGLSIATGIFVALGTFAMIASKAQSDILRAGLGLLAVGVAISLMSSSMSKIGKMNDDSWSKAIVALALMLGGMAAFAHFASGDAAKAGLAMIALATGIYILVGALALLAAFDPGMLVSGLVKMAVIIVGVAASFWLLGKAAATLDSKAIMNIVLLSGGLLMLAAALHLVATIPIMSLVIGIAALVATLVAVGVVLVAFSSLSIALIAVAAAFALIGVSALFVGAGLFLLVTALTSLIPLLMALSLINTDTLGKGLDVLKLIAEGLADAFKTLAVGVLAFGGACIVAGIGIAAIAIGLALVAIACLATSLAILALAGSLAVLAITIQSFFGGGLLGLLTQGFDDFAGGMKEKMASVFGGITEAFSPDEAKASTSQIFDAMGQGAEEGAANNKPIIEGAIGGTLQDYLDGQGLIDKQSFNQFGGELINEEALGLTNNSGTLDTALAESIGIDPSLFEGEKLKASDGGKSIMSALGSGLESKKREVENKGRSVAKAGTSAMSDRTSAAQAQKSGATVGMSYGKGVSSQSKSVATQSGALVSGGNTAAKRNNKSWSGLGSDAAQGYYNGIRGWLNKCAEAAANLVRGAKNAAKKEQHSHSPSKDFEQYGIWADQGYINGLKALSGKVASTAADVVGGGLDAVSNSISDMSALFTEDLDFEPTIRPVVDMSGVNEGISSINSSFADQIFNAGLNGALGNLSAVNGNVSKANDTARMLREMSSLTTTLDSMTETMNSRAMNNYVTVNGASDPSAFADTLVDEFRLVGRTI